LLKSGNSTISEHAAVSSRRNLSRTGLLVLDHDDIREYRPLRDRCSRCLRSGWHFMPPLSRRPRTMHLSLWSYLATALPSLQI
jgi:hypothetical protein